MLFELELPQCLLELGVRDRRLARDLGADEGEVVLEVDRAWPEVARLHSRHLRRALAAGARDRVVHLDRVGPAFQPRIIRHATGVHELVLLELVDQGGEGFEGETKALFERRAGQLIGEGERPEQQAGDQVPADVQVFQALGRFDRPGYHRAHILPSGARLSVPD